MKGALRAADALNGPLTGALRNSAALGAGLTKHNQASVVGAKLGALRGLTRSKQRH